MMPLPLMIILVGAFVTFLLARFSGKWKGLVGFTCASITIILAMLSLIPIAQRIHGGGVMKYPLSAPSFAAAFRFDALSLLLALTALSLGLLVAIFSWRYMEDDASQERYYPLLLIMLGAIVGISSAGDLFNLWVFFELMAVSSYILVSFRKDRWEPLEAGFKYLIMSAAGSMMVLLGITVIFGQTGHLDLLMIRGDLAASLPIMGAVALFIAGFSVKAAVVPFHTWLPDAHSEAPSGISAMLSGIVIEAGLFAMLRTLLPLAGLNINIGWILIALALLSMFVGNIMALAQTRLKRMLAYSSVAQMGYIVLGLGIGIQFLEPSGLAGGLFHVMTHAAMKGLAFLGAGIIIHSIGSGDIGDMSGLSRKMPLLSLCFAVSFLSLAGVPPLSGFMSKWLIYKSGMVIGGIGYLLSAAAIFNSVFSLGYYLPVLNTFYSQKVAPRVGNARSVSPAMLLPVVILALITILLGVYPELGLRVAEPAARYILMFLGGKA